MKITTYSLGQLQANCYFLIQDNKCLIIDPADSADFILEKLQRERLELVAMLATHGHFDHIMAAGEIQLSCDAPLYIHEKDLFLVKRLNETANYFLGFDPHALPPKNIQFLSDGNLLLKTYNLQLITTPGHTPGSCCFYIKDDNVLFTGDTLFKQGIGRYDFSYSDKKLLDQSLNELFKLPEETIVYSGHGEETTLGEEKNNLSNFPGM